MGVIVLALLGVLLIVAGAALVAPAAGLVTAGFLALAAAYLLGDV